MFTPSSEWPNSWSSFIWFLERTVTEKEVLHFSFNHRSKKRLRIAVWFTTKILFLIYLNNFENKYQLLAEMQREIEWNLKMSKGMGSVSEILALKECVLRFLKGNWMNIIWSTTGLCISFEYIKYNRTMYLLNILLCIGCRLVWQQNF